MELSQSPPAEQESAGVARARTVKRLASFALSVMPADRGCLWLLLGSTFLVIAPDLAWWPGLHEAALTALRAAGLAAVVGQTKLRLWLAVLPYASEPLVVAGAASFFVGFFPGKMPLRRLRLWVYTPAALGIALPLAIASLVLASPLGHNPAVGHFGVAAAFSFYGVLRLALTAGPGLYFALLGLACVAQAERRVRRGAAVLPVHLKSSCPAEGSLPVWKDRRNPMRFLWTALVLMRQVDFIGSVIAALVVNDLLTLVYLRYFRGNGEVGWLLAIVALAATPVFMLLLVLWAIEDNRLQALREGFRLPFPEYLALALLLPIMVYSVPQIIARPDVPSSWLLLPSGAGGPPGYGRLYLMQLLSIYLIEEFAWRGATCSPGSWRATAFTVASF